MRKMLMAMVVGGVAVLGVGAKAAEPIPAPATPQVQVVDWDGWHHQDGWRRHEAREHWRQHEHWARWHHWREGREGYYGW